MSGSLIISAEYVRSILDYDPATGDFIWRKRIFAAAKASNIWNARFAGTVAGTLNNRGYKTIMIGAKRYYAHRIAWLWMTGEWPRCVDHRDLNCSNNRWCNLRDAKISSNNQANRRAQSNNKSGLKGAHWFKRDGRWRSEIGHDGRSIHLGYFDTAEEAHAAYASAALELFGEFARSK